MENTEDCMFGFCNMDALKMHGQVGQSRVEQTTSLLNAVLLNYTTIAVASNFQFVMKGMSFLN